MRPMCGDALHPMSERSLPLLAARLSVGAAAIDTGVARDLGDHLSSIIASSGRLAASV